MQDPCGQCDKLEERNSFFRKYKEQLLDTLKESTDVTSSNQIDVSLNDERLQLLADATFEGICIHNQGEILDANQQFCDMFGYTLDEVVGMECFNLVAPQSQEMVRGHIESGFEGPYESYSLHKDGFAFPVEVRIRQFQNDGNVLRFAVFRDLTNQKELEQQISKSEEKYRELYEYSPIALSRTRISDGKLLECNQALVELLGYDSKEEMQSLKNVTSQYIDPNDRSILLERLKKYKRVEGYQTQLRRKNGNPIWVEITAEIFPAHNFLEGAMKDVTATKVLTKAEKKVLGEIIKGKSNSEVAFALGRSVRTIEDHRARCMRKLKAENLVQLIDKARSLLWET
jgi:PAS domain S-box-containing protein